jgi:hypothetical protein
MGARLAAYAKIPFDGEREQIFSWLVAYPERNQPL